ncbi:hypothetical protein [Streptantibioticus ferralitis]|uniref:Uncharacterized protein n=1 Tax=Streptantibioticus ferralitis TaxID=236510 RepID=A0ABT5YVS5_9ACTN|nr:hypothetical protein [Streptantibioticus ferralitis]MDF2255534.1 hypothetical protein [Streptantibioticus ferralitis]
MRRARAARRRPLIDLRLFGHRGYRLATVNVFCLVANRRCHRMIVSGDAEDRPGLGQPEQVCGGIAVEAQVTAGAQEVAEFVSARRAPRR